MPTTPTPNPTPDYYAATDPDVDVYIAVKLNAGAAQRLDCKYSAPRIWLGDANLASLELTDADAADELAELLRQAAANLRQAKRGAAA